MGCSQSKIENEEAVTRCKNRKLFMKAAVKARNAFAAAHSSYAMSLKNAGAALSDYAQGEVSNAVVSLSSTSSAPPDIPGPTLPAQPPPPTLPPPPPPIPDMPPPPLQRAVSMPEFVVSKHGVQKSDTIAEEEGEEEEEEEEEERFTRRRGGKGGSVGGRMENSTTETPVVVVEERDRRGNVPPPPPAETGNPTWDYFFNVEMPGASLEDVDHARKVYDEMPKRAMVGPPNIETVVMDERGNVESIGGGWPPRPDGGGRGLRKGKQVMGPGFASGSGSGGGGGGGEGGKRRSVNMVQLFAELDDCFLKASESAHDVIKMLEAARLHYHSNFADNRGHIGHSARVMRVITWNRSFRGLPHVDDSKDDFDSDGDETHATVLDKLLAWEKKLFDEVKAGEVMKYDYQRKVALLNKQKKRGTQSESLEKIKASVSHLHTRYIVDMQSMDSTVSEINRLRDEQLYPKLVALVDAMASMWEAMQGHHETQLKISAALRFIDISQAAKETTEQHQKDTLQLWAVVQDWNTQFDKMVKHQKEYIRALNDWLKLNLIPIESNLKEKVSSPPRVQNPPIQGLLLAWHDLLEKLPDEHAKSAIFNFGAVLQTLVQQQEDEVGRRAKMEESRRDYEKKQRQYSKWLTEHMQKRTTSDDMEPTSYEDGIHKDELMVEKEFVLENAKKKWEEDTESWERQCLHVREKSLVSLKTRLPELFRALSDFAIASSDMYNNLKAIYQSQNHRRRDPTA